MKTDATIFPIVCSCPDICVFAFTLSNPVDTFAAFTFPVADTFPVISVEIVPVALPTFAFVIREPLP
ncbi:hypothetical protein AR158_C046R [Paramecium bursaria Chlorella virus AR158]|uniref:hypothetical protein n=1 Tax=Paramecium bursaria Chlorella virus AR158 TaxID=380598 RepID=UPI00015AA74C|nr:hypothetical protein AR158_C046R [Paramecium bursaria Chlorella virus AR158]ABU43592.1 hypothetical protein AR158_C046R [Paramecium bursaria Chlorella virus AR158]